MNPLPMVRAGLRRHLPSSLGIVLLLALAFSATVAVSIFERGLRHAGADTSRDTDLVIGAPGSSLQLVLTTVFLQTSDVLPLLDESVMTDLQADPRVRQLSPLVFADHWGNSPIVGVGADFPLLKPRLVLAAGRWPQVSFEVAVGSAAGLAMGQELESAHGVAAVSGFEEAHAEVHYRVVGVLEPTGTPWDRGIYTPYEGLWEIHGLGDEESGADGERGISAVLVRPRDFAAAYALRAEYGKDRTVAVFPAEVLARVFAVFEDVKTAFTGLSFLFQLIVFAAVLLSILASLPSRARWIGLLRALGAGRLYVFATLWLESAAVFLLAGVAGAVVGWTGARGLAEFLHARTGLSLPVSFTGAELASLVIFWGAGLAGAVVPAWRGFRVSVRRAFQEHAAL